MFSGKFYEKRLSVRERNMKLLLKTHLNIFFFFFYFLFIQKHIYNGNINKMKKKKSKIHITVIRCEATITPEIKSKVEQLQN